MYLYLPTLKSGWLSGDLVSHLHSLHPKVDEIYTFTNLNGTYGEAKILEINKKLTSYKIEFGEILTQPKPPEKILFQHQTEKLYLEKLMELMPIAGISKIYIYNGDFSPKQNLQTERLTKILIRSCEQSHNLFLPEIEVLDKKTWLHKIKEHKPKWLHQTIETKIVEANFNSPNGTVTAKTEPVSPQGKEVKEKYPYGLGVVSATEVACLAGPEGGFSKKEEELYTSLNLEKVQLGQNILPAWLAGYTFFANNFNQKT